eukprot:5868834-Lingulodinium_polyedra.AAC.1
MRCRLDSSASSQPLASSSSSRRYGGLTCNSLSSCAARATRTTSSTNGARNRKNIWPSSRLGPSG